MKDMKGRYATGGDRRPDITADSLKRLYIEEKKTVRQICAQFACSNRTILRRLKRLGITRSPHEAVRLQWAKGIHRQQQEHTLERWRAGNPAKHKGKRGYIIVRTPSGQVPEHHLVWSAHNAGVQVPAGYVVHHINQNKTDNRIENLQFMPSTYHKQLHAHLRGRNLDGTLV